VRKIGRVYILLIIAVFLLTLPTAISQDNLPATVLQQIENRIETISTKQDIILNSLADWKVQSHEDLNNFITKEEFNTFKSEITSKIDSKPDFSTIIASEILVGGLFTLLFLLFKARGLM